MRDLIKRCGFVSITGFPNAGKSTLMNNLIEDKVSIISKKAQTTRVEIKGILNKKLSQIIFIDTPGILKPRSFLDKNMSRSIVNAFDSSDINLLVFDVQNEVNIKTFKIVLKLLQRFQKNILILNKIDTIEKNKLLDISSKINSLYAFDNTLMISALRKKGLKELIDLLVKRVPKRPWIYNKEVKTDLDDEFLFSEITREKIFELLNKELPYSVKIETSIMNEENKVYQRIFVDKESQKPIIIGKNGSKIKQIGIRARQDIESKLKKKIFLELNVSLRKK